MIEATSLLTLFGYSQMFSKSAYVLAML